jgi:hypothetical protein
MKDSTSFDAYGSRATDRTGLVRPIHVTVEEELEFLVAMEAYKCQSGRNFPTLSEILEVICSLGYAKRIWRPVRIWSPLPSELLQDESQVEDPSGVLGWFSRVETPVGP